MVVRKTSSAEKAIPHPENGKDGNAPPAADVAQWIAQIVSLLRIAHQVRGRVRLKLTPAALSRPASFASGLARLKQGFDALPAAHGVRDVQFNLLAHSCVITYDDACIPDAAWPDLLAGKATPAAAVLHDLLMWALKEPSLP